MIPAILIALFVGALVFIVARRKAKPPSATDSYIAQMRSKAALNDVNKTFGGGRG